MMLYCIKFYKCYSGCYRFWNMLILILERSMKEFFIHLIVKLKLLINQMM